MARVIIESPFSAPDEETFQQNLDYARACLRRELELGNSPIAFHLLYTQEGVLDDSDPTQRDWGIKASFLWHSVADFVAVYGDLGISGGMLLGMNKANELGVPVEYRWLGEE